MVSVATGETKTAGGGSANSGAKNFTPSCKVEAGRSETRNTHCGVVQAQSETFCWIEARADAAAVGQ